MNKNTFFFQGVLNIQKVIIHLNIVNINFPIYMHEEDLRLQAADSVPCKFGRDITIAGTLHR